VTGAGPPRPTPGDLAALATGLRELGDRVAESLARATHAAVVTDLDAARAVVAGDDVVDALATRLEERADELLRGADGDDDVRALLSTLHLVTEIAQVGDVAVDIAKTARRLYRSWRSPRLTGLVERAGEDALRLFRLAIVAATGEGVDPGEACRRMEGQLEDLSSAFVQTVLDAGGRPDGPDPHVCVQMALLGRGYERVGHHATTIAEWAWYRAHGTPPPPIATSSFARRTRAARLRPPGGPDAPQVPA
jgi:phosphate transport system protein